MRGQNVQLTGKIWQDIVRWLTAIYSSVKILYRRKCHTLFQINHFTALIYGATFRAYSVSKKKEWLANFAKQRQWQARTEKMNNNKDKRQSQARNIFWLKVYIRQISNIINN